LADVYDEVRYPNLPRHQTHPAYIAALARIAGMNPPPVERWSVLEIGCGDGSNILPLAFDYPEGTFVGVDRAQDTVEAGREFAHRCGVANLDLCAADLLDWQPNGEFDYIIVHGVYSWVPEGVREKILQICGAALKPRGIAFVSYNALPGCHFRRFAWDLLRYHTRRNTDPASRIASARDLARVILEFPGEGPLHAAIRKEMESVLERDPAALYHDDLNSIHDPFYLIDFVARAECHGLQCLGDADPQRDDVEGLPVQAENWLESQQYGDFLAKRRFRETLLCRRDIPLDRRLLPDRFSDLYAASRVQPAAPQEDGRQTFAIPNSGDLTTNHPFAKDFLGRLAARWPLSMQVSEFFADPAPGDSIAGLLMRLLRAKAIELRAHPPRIAASLSQKPVASALSRAQVAQGSRFVTNQRHRSIRFEDEISRMLLSLLDGSRDRVALARDLAASGPVAAGVADKLEAGLAELHRLSLLIE